MTEVSVVVIGGKGTAVNLAESIVDAARRFSLPLRFRGFAIDDAALGASINGYPVLCGTREVHRLLSDATFRVLFSLYKPDRMPERIALLDQLRIPADRLLTFVHPSAYVAPSATIGRGTAILANAAIHSNAQIGTCCIVNSHVVIEHDTCVEANCFISAGAIIGSNVKLGRGCFVGLSTAIRESTSIGDYAFLGMAANVVRSVPPHSVVYGNPARERQR